MGAYWKPGRWVAAVVVGATATGSAPAFYFKGWPGAGLQTPPSLIQPTAPTWSNPPSGRTENPPTNPPREWTEKPPNPPQEAPEPGTLLLAALGLAGLGARRLRIV